MHTNNPAMDIEIAVWEFAYMKIMDLNPDVDMESLHCWPHVQELLQEMETLNRLTTTQIKQQEETKNNESIKKHHPIHNNRNNNNTDDNPAKSDNKNTTTTPSKSSSYPWYNSQFTAAQREEPIQNPINPYEQTAMEKLL